MPGGVTNTQMTLDAKIKMISLRGISVVTSGTFPVFTYARGRVAVVAIRFTVEVALTSAEALVLVGTVATPNALLESYSITHLAPVNAKFAPTLASTLLSKVIHEAKGYPIVPANTLLIFTTNGGPNAGIVTMEMDYFKLDETSG